LQDGFLSQVNQSVLETKRKEDEGMKRLLLLAGVLTAMIVVPVASASADYGKSAVRQIELSANLAGREGGGVWLWIELNSNHTGDYTGSDCGHGGQGAASDKGDVEWESVTMEGKEELVITGVILNGLAEWPTVVTVPAKVGHYKGALGTFLTLPPFIIPPEVAAVAGNSQLQVAP
jgi:hypothetical protein